MSSTLLLFLSSLPWSIASLLVSIVGLIVAIRRWNRHPGVSALVVASLATSVVATLAYRLAVAVLVGISNRGSAGMASIGVYFALAGTLMSLIRTAYWAALVAAIFGWRSDSRSAAPLQFSIRGILGLTLAVALLCGIGRALAGWFANTSPLLLQLLDDTPVAICLMVGISIAVARWHRHPDVSRLATLGFSMSLFATTAMQLAYVLLVRQSNVLQFQTPFNLAWIAISVAGWALAIVAALGWRRPDVPSRDHSAFLSGYAAEDEGLYDDLPSGESRTPA